MELRPFLGPFILMIVAILYFNVLPFLHFVHEVGGVNMRAADECDRGLRGFLGTYHDRGHHGRCRTDNSRRFYKITAG